MPQRRRLPIALSAFLLGIAALLPLAAQEAPKEPPTSGLAAHPIPLDGEWYEDEEGRQYFVRSYPRKEGAYQWVDDTRVRIAFGVVVDLAGYDDESFYIKVYRTDDIEIQPVRVPPTQMELDAKASEYQTEAAESSHFVASSFDEGLPREGQWRNGFGVGDMNGDGHADIVFATPRKGGGPPPIFLGDGAGKWSVWQVPFPSFPYDYGGAALGDVDGDGRLDLALAVHLRGLTVLRSRGQEGFELWNDGLEFVVAGKGAGMARFSSRTPVLADWNGDGLEDLIALGEGPRPLQGSSGPSRINNDSYGTILYLNQGEGRWSRREHGVGPDQLFGDHILVLDIDGDGRLDLLTSSNRQNRRDLIQLGQPDGTWKGASVDPIPPNTYVRAIAAEDFDGDGHVDIALGYMSFELGVWRSAIDVMYGSEALQWRRRVLWSEESREGIWALDAGDLDGDGVADLAAASGQGRVLLFRGDGEGFFTRDIELPMEPDRNGCRGFDLEVEDLDGDGSAEVVVGFAGEPSPMWAAMDPRGYEIAAAEMCPGFGSLRVWKVAGDEPLGP